MGPRARDGKGRLLRTSMRARGKKKTTKEAEESLRALWVLEGKLFSEGKLFPDALFFRIQGRFKFRRSLSTSQRQTTTISAPTCKKRLSCLAFIWPGNCAYAGAPKYASCVCVHGRGLLEMSLQRGNARERNLAGNHLEDAWRQR